jgi:exonuclease III
MQRNNIGPHFICLTDHHLKKSEITKFSFEGYVLASDFCRKVSMGGGACIFTHKSTEYQPIDLSNYYEKTLEICAIKLQIESLKLIIFCIYRAPTGNLEHFLSLMEKMLTHLLQPKLTFLICGDLNINLLTKSNNALKLLTLMNTFNLIQVVNLALLQACGQRCCWLPNVALVVSPSNPQTYCQRFCWLPSMVLVVPPLPPPQRTLLSPT